MHAVTDKRIPKVAVLLALSLALFIISRFNYLLFHSLVEIFSIVVAFVVFLIAWKSKHVLDNGYLYVIGIAYLFIGFLDLLHTLSYKGMSLFTDYEYYANQLWIGTRYMESITLFAAFAFLGKRKSIPLDIIFPVYFILTALLITSIFYWKVFPECFIEGTGLTPFKKVSEYIISAILVGSIFALKKNKSLFAPPIYRMILWSIILTIGSELAFTFYISNYGISNLVGHYFKLFSFMLIYSAIIKTGIENPYQLIFRSLNKANEDLISEIEKRRAAQRRSEHHAEELQKAFDEIKVLQGILPICMHCKNIRDDKGYWNRIEKYITERSSTEFSHSICPECYEKYYKAEVESIEKTH